LAAAAANWTAPETELEFPAAAGNWELAETMSIEEAARLMSVQSEAALATLDGGRPYVSAVGYLYEREAASARFGKIFMLLSDLARHTKNLAKNPVTSLLVVEDNPNAPIHERKRVTLEGRVRPVDDRIRFEELRSKYLKVFPKSEIFFSLPDFRFYEMEISALHWIGGFGKAAVFK